MRLYFFYLLILYFFIIYAVNFLTDIWKKINIYIYICFFKVWKLQLKVKLLWNDIYITLIRTIL